MEKFKREVGEVDDCTDKDPEYTIVDVGASFDCSWSNGGWSARDGVVAAIAEDTGRILDVTYMSSSCSQCIKMEEKREG